MNVLVTGGAGFIGSNLVDRLIEGNHNVTVIDNESADAHEQFYWNENANNYKMDICDPNTSDLYQGVEVVFHLAAEARIQPCIENPLKAVQANTVGTATVLEHARRAGVKRVIYSSTSSAYGLANNPPLFEDMPNDCLNPYSVTKTSGEELCKMYTKLYGMETIILRYFNVYGNRQPLRGQYAPVIGLFMRQSENGEPMTIVGDGTQKRDFTHVSDVVDANMIIASKHNISPELCGEIYNVGTGTNYSINEVAGFIGGPIQHITERPGEAYISLASNKKIRDAFGWEPRVSLPEWIDKNLCINLAKVDTNN